MSKKIPIQNYSIRPTNLQHRVKIAQCLEQIKFQPGISVASSSRQNPTAEKFLSDGEYTQTKEYVRNPYFLFMNVL